MLITSNDTVPISVWRGGSLHSTESPLVTFRARHSRDEMYIGHGLLCVCLSEPRRIPTLLHGPGCNLDEWLEVRCSLVVHHWADFQSVHVFRCYDNIARTRNVSECLYSLYAWLGL